MIKTNATFIMVKAHLRVHERKKAHKGNFSLILFKTIIFCLFLTDESCLSLLIVKNHFYINFTGLKIHTFKQKQLLPVVLVYMSVMNLR